MGLIGNKSWLTWVISWCRIGDKPLPTSMVTHFIYISINSRQWVTWLDDWLWYSYTESTTFSPAELFVFLTECFAPSIVQNFQLDSKCFGTVHTTIPGFTSTHMTSGSQRYPPFISVSSKVPVVLLRLFITGLSHTPNFHYRNNIPSFCRRYFRYTIFIQRHQCILIQISLNIVIGGPKLVRVMVRHRAGHNT